MSCNMVSNQQEFLPVLNNVAPEAKMKHHKRQKRVKNQTKCTWKISETDRMVQITIKKYIDYFQQDFNDPASILIVAED